jgi:hypothetical protein
MTIVSAAAMAAAPATAASWGLLSFARTAQLEHDDGRTAAVLRSPGR